MEDLKQQNEQRCEQEIEEIKEGIRSRSTLDTSLIRFSDEALDEQKHSIRIADEKVALAAQAYELVSAISAYVNIRWLLSVWYKLLTACYFCEDDTY